MEENANPPEKLFVGAKIYRTFFHGKVQYVYTIDRVTATMAFDGDTKFRIEVSNNGHVKRLGYKEDRFASSFYKLETEELKERYWRQKAFDKIQTVDFNKLSNEQLKNLLTILDITL